MGIIDVPPIYEREKNNNSYESTGTQFHVLFFVWIIAPCFISTIILSTYVHRFQNVHCGNDTITNVLWSFLIITGLIPFAIIRMGHTIDSVELSKQLYNFILTIVLTIAPWIYVVIYMKTIKEEQDNLHCSNRNNNMIRNYVSCFMVVDILWCVYSGFVILAMFFTCFVMAIAKRNERPKHNNFAPANLNDDLITEKFDSSENIDSEIETTSHV